MVGSILVSAIGIGGILVFGGLFIPNNIVMWFMSEAPGMMAWREILLVTLIFLALVRPYFDNRPLRAVWGTMAAILLFAGYQYFVDNAAYVFDVLFMMTAGISFAIAALETVEEPEPVIKPVVHAWMQRAKAAGSTLQTQLELLNQHSTLHVINWQNMQNTEHRMLLRRNLQT